MSTRPLKPIAVIAHDQKKTTLCQWMVDNQDSLRGRDIFATGTTGQLIQKHLPDFSITRLKSGPLGGDQQIGALIAEGQLDAVFFFQDPMTAQPHDVDIKALVRLATLYDVPLACNPSTANYIVSSPYFNGEKPAPVTDAVVEHYQDYLNRVIEG
jgi:methylglyoxal synthase